MKMHAMLAISYEALLAETVGVRGLGELGRIGWIRGIGTRTISMAYQHEPHLSLITS